MNKFWCCPKTEHGQYHIRLKISLIIEHSIINLEIIVFSGVILHIKYIALNTPYFFSKHAYYALLNLI
jgi:hypothetical protein